MILIEGNIIHSSQTKPEKCGLICISDLEEAALPLDGYASLRDFFVRTLKDGCRPIDPDPQCLVTGNQLGRDPILIFHTLCW